MRWFACGATSAVRVRVVAVKEGGAWTAVCAVCAPSEVAQGPSQFGLRQSVLRWSRLDAIGTHVLGLVAATMALVKRDGLFRILAHWAPAWERLKPWA